MAHWRDLLLWQLLTPGPCLIPPGVHATKFPQQIRRILFEDLERDRSRRLAGLQIPRKRILSLRNLRSLDALHALLYLARESELIGNEPRHLLPAVCAIEILPEVLHQNAPLRYRWEALFACIERILSRRLRPDGPCLKIARDQIATALEALSAAQAL